MSESRCQPGIEMNSRNPVHVRHIAKDGLGIVSKIRLQTRQNVNELQGRNSSNLCGRKEKAHFPPLFYDFNQDFSCLGGSDTDYYRFKLLIETSRERNLERTAIPLE